MQRKCSKILKSAKKAKNAKMLKMLKLLKSAIPEKLCYHLAYRDVRPWVG